MQEKVILTYGFICYYMKRIINIIIIFLFLFIRKRFTRFHGRNFGLLSNFYFCLRIFSSGKCEQETNEKMLMDRFFFDTWAPVCHGVFFFLSGCLLIHVAII